MCARFVSEYYISFSSFRPSNGSGTVYPSIVIFLKLFAFFAAIRALFYILSCVCVCVFSVVLAVASPFTVGWVFFASRSSTWSLILSFHPIGHHKCACICDMPTCDRPMCVCVAGVCAAMCDDGLQLLSALTGPRKKSRERNTQAHTENASGNGNGSSRCIRVGWWALWL